MMSTVRAPPALPPQGLPALVDSAWAGVIKNNPLAFARGKKTRHLRKAKQNLVGSLTLFCRNFPLWLFDVSGNEFPSRPHRRHSLSAPFCPEGSPKTDYLTVFKVSSPCCVGFWVILRRWESTFYEEPDDFHIWNTLVVQIVYSCTKYLMFWVYKPQSVFTLRRWRCRLLLPCTQNIVEWCTLHTSNKDRTGDVVKTNSSPFKLAAGDNHKLATSLFTARPTASVSILLSGHCHQ